MKKSPSSCYRNFISWSFAQNDVMQKHSGEKLDVKVIKIGEETISYKYPGEALSKQLANLQ